MRHDRIPKAVAVLLLVSMNATMLLAQSAVIYPQAQPGVAFPDVGVLVRDKPVYYTVAVYPGDKVQTGATSTLLTWEGASINMHPNTSLIFGKVIDLSCGGVLATLDRTSAIRVNGIEIAPTAEATKIEVVNALGTVSITVQSGSAALTENGQKSVLAQGQSVARPGTQGCAALAQASKDNAPATSNSRMKRKLPWILGGGAGAGVVGGVLATRREGPVSPSRP